MRAYEFTTDLRITVAPEHTLEELVDVILNHEQHGTGRADLFALLTNSFGLSYDDARLAVDRVAAGRVRAATGQASNAPDPSRDPVAALSYRRAMGTPAAPRKPSTSTAWEKLLGVVKTNGPDDALEFARSDEFAAGAQPQEQEAAVLCLGAVEATPLDTQSATSSAAALRLLELADTMADAPFDRGTLQRVLLQVGRTISELGKARISERGPGGHVWKSTPAWFDAIRLGEAAGELSRLFGRIGDSRSEGIALELRARNVTSLLWHCQHRVGAAMLDHVRYCLRTGQNESAASSCEAIISDFRGLIEECEIRNTAPLDEEAIALEQLAEAISIYAELRGSSGGDLLRLRDRSSDLLERYRPAPE
jgi:hypothetical protein